MSTTNWAGNYQYAAQNIHRPSTLEELAGIVASSDALHVLGSRHSFNDAADTPGDLISLDGLPADVVIDGDSRTVSLSGGVTYGMLAGRLNAAGWALHNLASLPHISVAGAVATGTHGSGSGNGGLATAVRALELLTSNGESLSFDADSADFPGLVVGLGAIGVVTRLTLAIEPTFTVRQFVFEHLPFDELIDNFAAISGSAYSVSVFTDWTGPAARQVWVKTRETLPPNMFGATPATGPMHPLPEVSAESCTEQLGVPGTWSDRLPHFKLEFTPSKGAEVQSEYLIGRKHASAAITALRGLGATLAELLLVSEIRTVAASDLWLDPAYRRDSVAFHFTWRLDQPAVEAVLPLIEEVLAPFQPRPHWGKLFTMSAADLNDRYEKLPAFRALAQRLDSRGAFRNAYLDRTIWSS